MQTIQVGDTVMFTKKNDPLHLSGIRIVKRIFIKSGNGVTQYHHPCPVSRVKRIDLECGDILLTAAQGEFQKLEKP